MNRTLWWLALLFIIAEVAPAQVLRGTITDAETGSALPAASIHVENTYRGTITNAEGFYELKVEDFPVTLVVRFLGYETLHHTIERGVGLQHDFQMIPTAYEMETLTVTGENPAINIMRQVIERKQQWRATLSTYEVQAYSRFSISGDSSVLWVNESASTAYWDRDRGMKESIKGNRSTSNPFIYDSIFPVAHTVANLYDDNVFIAGHNLVGVTHPNALDVYDFAIIGAHMHQGTVVYDISATPKNPLSSAFVGRVAILDSAFVMMEAELAPGESFLFPMPIKRYEVTYRQQFSSYGQDYWMPVDFRSTILAELNMPGLLSFPPFDVDHVARFSDYQINVPVPEELYATDDILEVDSVAVAAGEVFDEPGVVVPLTVDEAAAFENPDIDEEFEEAFTPGGLIGRMATRYGNSPGNEGNSTESDTTRSPGARSILRNIEPRVWYNRVDGAHLGLHRTFYLTDFASLGIGGGWNSSAAKDERWRWHASIRLASPGNRSFFTEGRYENATARRYGDPSYLTAFFNGLLVLAGEDDYFDYYRRRGYSASAGFHLRNRALRLWTTFLREDHASLPMTTSYDFLGRAPQRDNSPIIPGRMQSLSVHFTLGRKTFFSGRRGNRSLNVSAEFGLPGSDFMFRRYALDATWRQPTFGQRRLLPALLDLRFILGYGTTTLPVQRAFSIDNAAVTYSQLGALRSRSGRFFEGDAILAVLWEHNFRTMIFEALGLQSIAQEGYSIIVYGGHARTWLHGPPEDPQRFATQETIHELGGSIAGIFGWLRVDVTTPLTGGPTRVGLGMYFPF